MPDSRKKYFPEFEAISGSAPTTLKTCVRLKHTDGKWYTTYIIYGSRNDEAIKGLLFNTYMMLLFGKVDTTSVDSYGKSIWELDEDQHDEKERMQQMLPHLVLK